MDETLTAWVFLFIVLVIWLFGKCLRTKALWVQWYTWLFILFGSLQVRSLIDIVMFDFGKIGFPLSAAIARDQLRQVNTDLHGGFSETDLQGFYMGTSLSKIASAVPILSTLAFLLVAFHVFHLHFISARLAKEERGGAAAHWILAILSMPATLATMALRSWMRTVMLMTGSAYQSLGKPCPHDQSSLAMGILKTCGYSFGDVSELEYRTSETDLEVAAACQYFAVFCFVLACIHCFNANIKGRSGAIVDYMFAVKRVGFIGVWIYVVVGTAQSVMNILLAFAANLNIDTTAAQGIKTASAPLMSLCTILCVLNMGPILKIRDLTNPDYLGSWASAKFMGTRILLLAGTMLPKILTFILAPKDADNKSALQIALDKYVGPGKWPGSHAIEHAGQSIYQLQLWNSSLLCFVCVLVAVANLILWRKMPCKPRGVAPELEARLLP